MKLNFRFSTDNNTYDVETQFMWGSALLITPVLYEQTFEVTGYVPNGRWFDYYTVSAQSARRKILID